MFGPALASVLNDSYEPSGRTSVTWYQETSQLPNMTNYDMTFNPGRTYRYLTQNPIYSFDAVQVTFDTKNVGNNGTGYDSAVDEPSMVYLPVLNNTVATDNILLVNFTKSLQAAKDETRTLNINPAQMTVTKDYEYVKIVEIGYYQVLVMLLPLFFKLLVLLSKMMLATVSFVNIKNLMNHIIQYEVFHAQPVHIIMLHYNLEMILVSKQALHSSSTKTH